MKILFLSPTKGLLNSKDNIYNGGGWISSIQKYLENDENIELALAYKDFNFEEKIKFGRTIYYPIKIKKQNPLEKLLYYWHKYKQSTFDDSISYKIKTIIEDFKPDIIHIFGTESEYGYIIGKTTVPCVIHIQGILSPISNAFYPPGCNEKDLKKISDITEFWLHNGMIFNKKRMQLAARREKEFISKSRYVIGRTEWDRHITKFYNKELKYFHVDEILRPEFYNATKWKNDKKNLILVSTLSENLYKGLDLILKTAKHLQEANIIFKWQVIGIKNGKFTKKLERLTGINSEEVNIEYLGIKNAEGIIGFLQSATIYLHPSYIDNSPNSLCEAQYIGIPCIASYVGGIPTLMKDMSNWLVPTNDPIYTAAKILDLFHSICNNTYNNEYIEHIIERHNKTKIVNSLKQVYNYILTKNEKNN